MAAAVGAAGSKLVFKAVGVLRDLTAPVNERLQAVLFDGKVFVMGGVPCARFCTSQERHWRGAQQARRFLGFASRSAGSLGISMRVDNAKERAELLQPSSALLLRIGDGTGPRYPAVGENAALLPPALCCDGGYGRAPFAAASAARWPGRRATASPAARCSRRSTATSRRSPR